MQALDVILCRPCIYIPDAWSLLLQTLFLSVGVGSACSMFPIHIVLEALAITAAIVVGLTVYAFHAARKGVDFTFMGPILMSSKALPVQYAAARVIAQSKSPSFSLQDKCCPRKTGQLCFRISLILYKTIRYGFAAAVPRL